MAKHALFSGSFDPPTLGHLDCALRTAQLFERVTLVVSVHPTKAGFFSVERRVKLLEECLAEAQAPASIEVRAFSGLTVAACAEFGCDLIVRGARSGQDYEYEAQMASTNRLMSPGLETLVMVSAPALAHTTSTLVRQIAQMGGDVSGMVPPAVLRALAELR